MFCARAEIEHVIATIFQPGGRSEISARAEIHHIISPLAKVLGNRFNVLMSTLAFSQCGLGSISELNALPRLTLLVLCSAPRSFSQSSPVSFSDQKPKFDLICYDEFDL